jgi:signal transduction histidine kinase
MRLPLDFIVRIELRLDREMPPVNADPDRLQQVVVNLLANGIKFTPEGGAVEVELRRADPSTAEIVVHDHGIGIRREFLPYVFERFRQSDGNSGARNQGLGLGLSIVRDIVEKHGGSVVAESAGEGKGSTFRVLLPLHALEPITAPQTTRRALAPPLEM